MKMRATVLASRMPKLAVLPFERLQLLGRVSRNAGPLPAIDPRRGQSVCANFIVESGHLPSWPPIEIRSPWNSVVLGSPAHWTS